MALQVDTAQEVYYDAYGAAWELMESDAPEIVLSGPAGTGKSRACLEKLNWLAENYPGARCLMLRKTRRSLTESGMVTLERKVFLPSQRVIWNSTTQQYRYPNGSIIAVGGLDKPGKIMSSEWDVVYVQEATELTENDWEAITTRLRNGKGPYHQLLGDCNPDAPTHWLRLRAERGQTLMLESQHEDNPTVTPAYLAKLDALSGVRYLRLRRGIWAAAEGMIYADSWNRAENLIDRAVVSNRPQDLRGDCGIPTEWARYLVVDFGYTHPFVAKWYAMDGDGRLYRYREIYMTHRLVTDHAQTILDYSKWGTAHGDPLPRAIITDHDAEDRATLERELGLITIPAHKGVSDGIQAVANRWRPAGDGKPRLYYLRDSLVKRDPYLTDAKLPTCSEEEIESYVWDARKEAPVKENDHGMDCDRYMVAERDVNVVGNVQYFEVPF